MKQRENDGASLLVECLEAHNVKYIFGVPGASLMPLLDVLHDRGPEFIVCRHEQNAAFMAQAWGRLTGQPGVCLATVGPGATNLITGAATATADRDPLVAFTGQTPRNHLFQNRHQNIDAAALFSPVTKWSAEIEDPTGIPEAVAQAFHIAKMPRQGATHLAFPMDVLQSSVAQMVPIVKNALGEFLPNEIDLRDAAALLRSARRPVMLVGVGASDQKTAQAVRRFLAASGMPAACTLEGSGIVGRKLVSQFLGRVGLSTQEPGDAALNAADVVLAVGYDIVEYAPSYWNTGAHIIHVDRLAADIDADYNPKIELIGEIATTLDRLEDLIGEKYWALTAIAKHAVLDLERERTIGKGLRGKKVHPARLVAEIRKALDDNDLLVSDVGAHQMWLARACPAYEPRTLFFSMGFQTMGVALPWAIAARLTDGKRRIISCSGDGSFLMSVMELETAVRRKLPLVHIIWRDGGYNLVEMQQNLLHGRTFGTKFGNPDFVQLAESFGAVGIRIHSATDIGPAIARALRMKQPVIIDVPVDYSHNLGLLDHGSLFHG